MPPRAGGMLYVYDEEAHRVVAATTYNELSADASAPASLTELPGMKEALDPKHHYRVYYARVAEGPFTPPVAVPPTAVAPSAPSPGTVVVTPPPTRPWETAGPDLIKLQATSIPAPATEPVAETSATAPATQPAATNP